MEMISVAECDSYCGTENQKRFRKCNNPTPANGRLACSCSETKNRTCYKICCSYSF